MSDAGRGGHRGGGHHGGGHRRGGGWRGGWSGPDVIVVEDCPVGFYRDEDGICYPLPAMAIARTASGLSPDASGPLKLTIEHAAGALFGFERGSSAGELSFPDTDTMKKWGIGLVLLGVALFVFRKRIF